jgi:hypothetical protein
MAATLVRWATARHAGGGLALALAALRASGWVPDLAPNDTADDRTAVALGASALAVVLLLRFAPGHVRAAWTAQQCDGALTTHECGQVRWSEVPAMAATVYWAVLLAPMPAALPAAVAVAAVGLDAALPLVTVLASVALVVHTALALPVWATTAQGRRLVGTTQIAALGGAGAAAARLLWLAVAGTTMAWPVRAGAAAVLLGCVASGLAIAQSEAGTVVDAAGLPAVAALAYAAAVAPPSLWGATSVRVAVGGGLAMLLPRRPRWAAWTLVAMAVTRLLLAAVVRHSNDSAAAETPAAVAAAAAGAGACLLYWTYDRVVDAPDRQSAFVQEDEDADDDEDGS